MFVQVHDFISLPFLPKMSVRTCQRCSASTKEAHRCKRRTCRTDVCFQHLDLLTGLALKPSHIPDAQLGLFATRPFKKKETVARYTGAHSALPIEGAYVLKVNKKHYIDAKKTSSSAGRYANDCRMQNKKDGHCNGNNAKLSFDYRNGRANIKAKRPIQAGEEVYVSYSRGYWEEGQED